MWFYCMSDAVGIKPNIRNVVSTANLNQKIDITRLADVPCGIYDNSVYRGRCGYVKTPEMDGHVTIFASGKMISVGGKSVKKSIKQLNHAKFYLVQNKLVKDVTVSVEIRNIVATLEAGKNIRIDILSEKIPGAVYDPETFPGMILKGLESCRYLVFASGKIVIVGTRTMDELHTASFEIIQRLELLVTGRQSE